MRRISSRLTWWNKKVFPVFWFGFLGLFALAWIPAVIQQQVPAPTLLIPIGMAAFGYVLMRWLVFSLMDEMWIDENDVVVRNHGREALSNHQHHQRRRSVICKSRAHCYHAQVALWVWAWDRVLAAFSVVAPEPTSAR